MIEGDSLAYISTSIGLATTEQLRSMRDQVRKMCREQGGYEPKKIVGNVAFDKMYNDFLVVVIGLPVW